MGQRNQEISLMQRPETKLIISNASAALCLLEANPEKFNSRFRNKMYYAGVSVLAVLATLFCLHVTPVYFTCICVCLSDRLLGFSQRQLQRPRQAHQSCGEWSEIYPHFYIKMKSTTNKADCAHKHKLTLMF